MPALLPAAARPREAALAIARRADGVIASRTGRRVVAGLNALVLTLAIAPFALWEGFGPGRFDEVELGQHPDMIDLDPGAPIAAPDGVTAAEWQAADLPYDLSPTTTVTLVFSVGSQGLGADEAERLRVHDVGDRGGDGLTDTMMLVIADSATREVALLSVPRDLWVHARGHRINATFNRVGLQAFVDDVARASGLPIHHLVRLNFGAFARLVDAVGGVAMQVDRPLADVPAVLYVPEAGCWRFDGAAALAWSRGRHTLTRDDDGDWVTDRSASDFGRIERQQALLGALWDQIRSPGAIGAIPQLLGVARDGLVVDDGLGVQEVRDLLAVFGNVAAGRIEGYTLPTTGQSISGAAAQVVAPEAATPILTRLRTWPPGPDEPAPSAAAVPRPRTDATVVAAPTSLALPPVACTHDVAQPLPDPRPPLGGVVASRDGSAPTQDTGRPDTGDAGSDPGASPSDGSSPPDGARGRETEEPSSTPSDPPPDEPSEEPSPEPSPTDSEDDGIIPLPWDDGGSGG